jgi:hypothetical protein
MDESKPILGYAHCGPAMEPREALQVIELRRPAAWAQIVLIALGLFLTIAAILALSATASRSLRRWNSRDTGSMMGSWIALMTLAGLSYVQITYLITVARAGRRPITLAIQNRTLLIDDVAVNASAVISVVPGTVRQLSLRDAGRSIALEPLWELTIQRHLDSDIRFYFVEKDPVRAELLVFDLYSGLGLST